MTMTAKKKKILFWSVLMLAIILRCIRFGSVPDGINQDEAMGAMQLPSVSDEPTALTYSRVRTVGSMALVGRP